MLDSFAAAKLEVDLKLKSLDDSKASRRQGRVVLLVTENPWMDKHH